MTDPFWNTVLTLLTCSGLWTALVELVKWLISRKSGIKKDIENIHADIDEIRVAIKDEKEARKKDKAEAWRSQIVRFNDELLNNTRHSKSMFDTSLISCSDYEKYCREHQDFQNGVATEAIDNIRRCYRQCEKDKDFL